MAGIGEIPARITMAGYYHFNGNSNDASGNGRHGTDVDMSYNLSTGKFNQGASFNGTTSKISITGWGSTTTYTISMWIYPIASSSTYANLVAQSTAGLFYRGNLRKLSLYVAGDHLSNTALTESAWYHVCVIVIANSGTFYINGAADGTFTTSGGFSATNFGNDISSQKFKGYMDEIIFENRAWSYAELKKYYSQAKGRTVPQ